MKKKSFVQVEGATGSFQVEKKTGLAEKMRKDSMNKLGLKILRSHGFNPKRTPHLILDPQQQAPEKEFIAQVKAMFKDEPVKMVTVQDSGVPFVSVIMPKPKDEAA